MGIEWGYYLDGKGSEKRDLFGSGLCSGLIGRDLPVKLASIVELKKKKIIVQSCATLHIFERAFVNSCRRSFHFLKPAVFLDQSSICWKGREGLGRGGN